MGGVIFTVPLILTARSLRGSETLNTPSFSLSLPVTPVSFSMLAVSRPPGAALGVVLAGVIGAAGAGAGCAGGAVGDSRSGGCGASLLHPNTSTVLVKTIVSLVRMTCLLGCS